MEHIKKFQKLYGYDVGKCSTNIHPSNREGCVGKQGIDKSYTLEMVIDLAFKMEQRLNIIIKGGQHAKWYFKQIPKEFIDSQTYKHSWNDVSKCTMYIIDWE